MLTRRFVIAAGLAHPLLTACAGGPAETTVDLAITGAADMNGGAPAQVKVYYLNDASAFRSADFFTVFNTPEAALGEALVQVNEFSLIPGRKVSDRRSFLQAPRAVGIVAAFRNINGPFLDAKPLVPGAANTVAVTLSGNRVVIG